MNRQARLRDCRGFTLVEVIVSAAILAGIALVTTRYATYPVGITSMLTTVNGEQTGYNASNLPIADLKNAVATSVQWNLIDPSQANPPYDPMVNTQFIPWFQIHDLSVPAPGLPFSYVCYAYNANTMTVVREYIQGGSPQFSSMQLCSPVSNDNAQQSIVAQNVLPPTAQEPLFSKDDAATNMVILTLQFPGNANTVTTIVRRAFIRS